jgi:hypothetical protein
MVSFNAVSTDTHTLGEPFLRQFVSTFDFDKNKVSFAQNVNAESGTKVHHAFSALDWILLSAGIVVGLGLIIGIIMCRRGSTPK